MELIFYVMAAVILASGVGVVVSHNPLHSALWLVANLLTVAGLFASLDAHFLAAAQIIVYAGAIMVLVIFVLMLLNLKVEAPNKRSPYILAFSAMLSVGFVLMVVPLLNRSFSIFQTPALPVDGSVREVGKLLFTRHIFPFELASVLIMAAIVGAVMLAKRKYR